MKEKNNFSIIKKVDFRENKIKKWIKFNTLKRLVWTDNDIAQNLMMPFTTRQFKIIDYAITEVKKNNIKSCDDKLKVSFVDIIKFLGKQKSGQLLKDIEKDVLYIKAITCWWRYDENDPRNKVAFSFFEKAHELENEDKTTFTLQFNQEFLDKLYNEKEKNIIENGKSKTIGFNNYEIWNTLNLNIKYSIIIYKKINSWMNTGYMQYYIEDMRKDFFPFDYINDNDNFKEKTFGYISSHCIKPAIKEINNKTDIFINNVKYFNEKGIENKKNVKYIIFYFRKQKNYKIQELLEKNAENIDNEIDKNIENYNKENLNKLIKREEIKEEKEKEKIDKLNKLLEENGYKKIENKNIKKIAKEREKTIIDDAIKSANYAVENNLPYVNGYIKPKEDVYDDVDNDLLNSLNDEQIESINKLSKEEIIDLYLEQLKKNKNGNS